MSKFIINEKEIRKIVRKYILEQVSPNGEPEKKQRCVSRNVIPLNDMVGPSDSFKPYAW